MLEEQPPPRPPRPKRELKKQNIILPPLEFRDRPVTSARPKRQLQKSVKQMIQDYEQNIQPPVEFRDDYIPVPPPTTKRTRITQTDQALKGCTVSYEISIKNNKDPLIQLQNTRKAF